MSTLACAAAAITIFPTTTTTTTVVVILTARRGGRGVLHAHTDSTRRRRTGGGPECVSASKHVGSVRFMKPWLLQLDFGVECLSRGLSVSPDHSHTLCCRGHFAVCLVSTPVISAKTWAVTRPLFLQNHQTLGS